MKKEELYSAYLQARLDRARQRMHAAESDLAYEDSRQTVLALEALLKTELRRVA